jgi:hypothetical protein
MLFAYKNQLQIFITEHLQIIKKYKQLKLSKIKCHLTIKLPYLKLPYINNHFSHLPES